MNATENQSDETQSEMKRSLRIAVLCVVMVGVLVWLLSLEYSRADDLLKKGVVDIATVLADSRSVTGRKGRISYVTDISISGTQTRVALKYPLYSGQRFRMLYSQEALVLWCTHRKGWFSSYMLGDASMSADALVEEKLGDTYTIAKWVIAAFGLGGIYLFYDYFRLRRKIRRA